MQESHLDLNTAGNLTFAGTITWHSLTDAVPTASTYTYTIDSGESAGTFTVPAAGKPPEFP
jgi:hypothetical protein